MRTSRLTLYSRPHSPYAARVRMAAYAADLSLEIKLPPPSAGPSPEFLSITPIGRVPTLVLPEGAVIPESETIIEYLADAFPRAGLRPTDPLEIARSRAISRIIDVYTLPAGVPLMAHFDPRVRDEAVVDAAFSQMKLGFGYVEHFLSADRFAVGATITTADCALVPTLFYLGAFCQVFQRRDPTVGLPKLSAYWSRIQLHPAARRVIEELRDGLAQEQARG